MTKRFRPSVLIPAVLAAAMLFSTPAGAQQRTFDLPAQDATKSIPEFARQAGIRISAPSEELRGMRTPEIKGELTTDEALGILLRGTGLTYEYVDSNTIAIRLKPLAGNTQSSMRMVQADLSSGTAASTQGSSAAAANEQKTASGAGKEGSAAADAADDKVQEVTVTAQRREERLENVPISISVLGGDELDRSTVRSVTEALSRVPGVAVDEGFQSGGTQLTVRGVTAASGFAFGSSPIGYYLDSVPFGLIRTAIAPDPAVFDLDRVEVLRGPQGTLYGAGGAGGVVRVLTKDAGLDKFELKARTDFSLTETGGQNSRADMAVNVPIIDGKLAVRAVLGYQTLSGWIDRPTRRDSNDGRLRNARLKINAQPTEDLSIGLSAWISRTSFGAMSTSADGYTNPNPDVESTSNDFESYGLKIGYDFSAFTLTSMTSYLEYDNDGFLDFTYSFGVPGLVLRTNPQAKTFAQEINLSSTLEGPWRWTAGGIYRDGHDRTLQSYNVGAIFPGTELYTSESWATFGELTRTFMDGRLELTAGLRYFEDDAGVQEESRLGDVQPPVFASSKKKFTATTPRVVLTWHPQERRMFYASYSEGFRSGLDQSAEITSIAPSIPPAKPDTLKNYEIGAKGMLWDGRAAYDAAIYYIDWQGVQLPINIIVDGVGRAAVINGASASGMGVDLALTTRPARGLELGINASWNNLETDSDVFSGGLILFNKGERLNHSPEYTLGAMGEYSFPMGREGFTGRFGASANLTSERSYRSLQGDLLVVRNGDALLVARTSFAIESPDRWTATLFIDNVADERGAVARQPFTAQGSDFQDWDTRLRPRTYGVQFDYRY